LFQDSQLVAFQNTKANAACMLVTCTSKPMSTLPKRTLLIAGGRTALIVLLVLAVQGCNRIFRVNEDPTGISEEQFARQKAVENIFGHPLAGGGLGQLIEGVAPPREMPPKAIRFSPEKEKIESDLLKLYVDAARQAPAVKPDLFHKIEELELRNGDIPA